MHLKLKINFIKKICRHGCYKFDKTEIFFNAGPTNVGHLFDHLLWSIFQSVVTHN